LYLKIFGGWFTLKTFIEMQGESASIVSLYRTIVSIIKLGKFKLILGMQEESDPSEIPATKSE
jgi:hypothetical protein